MAVYPPQNLQQFSLEDFQAGYSRGKIKLCLLETGLEIKYPVSWEVILDEYESRELGKLMEKRDDDAIDTVENAFGEFGYAPSNPIPVNDPSGERAYLEKLECQCGAPFLFRRMGSVGQGPDDHPVDIYDLVCKNLKHRIRLYMDMYHGTESQLIPKNLKVGAKKGVSIEQYLARYPEEQEKIKKIFSGS